jgi:hypothetical protein
VAILHLLRPFSELVVSDGGQRYVARACVAAQPDGRWDRWLIFLPFGHGLPLATDREIIESTFRGVKSWAEAMTRTDLQGALRRARACWPGCF